MNILLSKYKISEIENKLLKLKASSTSQQEEQVSKGGASDGWHKTASFQATQAALEAKVSELENIV